MSNICAGIGRGQMEVLAERISKKEKSSKDTAKDSKGSR